MVKRISFDLDDTLICHHPNALIDERKRKGILNRILPLEDLRLGSTELINQLIQDGWEIWIYTTSSRPPRYVKRTFAAHGLKITAVINHEGHLAKMRERGIPNPPSKHPGVFGIDLHIDDSPGVAEEGRRFGFRVLVIDPIDVDWAEKVLQAASG